MNTGENSATASGSGERIPGQEGLRNDQPSREDGSGSGDGNHPPGCDNNDPPPPDSDDNTPPPEPDTDDTPNFPPPPNLDEEEDDPAITLESLQTDLKFVGMVKDATLESQFSPAELHALWNPQATLSSLLDDKQFRLAISLYILSLDHNQSERGYNESQDSILECYPDSSMLSYDQAR